MRDLRMPSRLAAAVLILGTTPLLAEGVELDRTGKPNVVILFADDLGYGDLGSYGHPYIRTPELDALAREGQRWTDFYVAAPVCSPSRGALLTGRLPNRTGLYGRRLGVLFPGDEGGMPAVERTLAEALREVGYATGIIGKWHLGDSPDFYPTRHGFDYWYGIPYSNDMDWTDEPDFDGFLALRAQGRTDELQRLTAGHLRKYFEPRIEYWNVPVVRSRRSGNGFADEVVERPAQQADLTKTYTAQALQFIDANREEPFLLYVPYSMPHTPIFRSRAFENRSLGGRYGDVIEELDWSVGRIVARLRELGLERNTLVLFTSDNGPWLWMKQHGGSAGLLRHGKGTTFEGGMRVPAIFWWPGKVQPGTVSGMGATLDVFATVLALAGASSPAVVDGYDISDVLLHGRPSPRDAMPYYRQGELRAYRKGRYKLQLVTEGAYGQPPQRTVHQPPLLHDLATDPGERFDLAAERPELVRELLAEVEAHRRSIADAPPLFDRRLEQLRDD
jgi:arylsulfatase A